MAPPSLTRNPKSSMRSGAWNSSQYASKKLRFRNVHEILLSVGISALLRSPSLETCLHVSLEYKDAMNHIQTTHLRLAPHAAVIEYVNVLWKCLSIKKLHNPLAL